MMFSHLTALLSIILSLAIALLVQFAASLVHRRRNVRWSVPHLLWASVIFLGQIEFWLSTYDFRDVTQVSVASILFVVAAPVLYFLQAELVIPDNRPGDTVDLRAHHAEQSRGYIGAIVATDLLTIAFITYALNVIPGLTFGMARIWLGLLVLSGIAAMTMPWRWARVAMPLVQLVIRLGLLPILAGHLSGQAG